MSTAPKGLRGYNHTVTVVCGNTEALSVRGVRPSALLLWRPLSWRVLHMLLYHHPYSLSFSRFYSHICAVHWALGVLSVQLFFRCSTQAGKIDAPCSQQKGSGCRIIGSVSVPTPCLDSPTRSWCIGCKNASQTFCYSNNRHLLIRRVVPTGSWRKIKVVLAFVVKLEPLTAQKLSCLVSYPIGRRWGKKHAHAFDFD